MIPAPSFHGSKVAVFGLARSGLAAAQTLARSGAEVIAWDDNAARQRAARDAGLSVENLAEADWKEIDDLVVSPGIPIRFPEPHPFVAAARDAGVSIFGDIEIFARARPALPQHSVVAITGTNGKSTTTALVGHLLEHAGREVAIGGNIGTGVLSLDPLGAGGVYVLELSSYQLEQTKSLAADIALLLNISPDHLERHGGFDGYKDAKARLFSMQKPRQIAIISVDDAPSCEIAEAYAERVLPISGHKRVAGGVYVMDGALIDDREGARKPIARQVDWPALIGRHNAQNAAAAAAAALSLKIDAENIAEGLASFPGLAHRLEPVAEIEGVRFINDSKATNTDAAATALASFAAPIRWIVGGRAKSDGLGEIEGRLGNVVKAYLVGEAAPLFARLLGGKVEHEDCGTIANAVAAARRESAPGDVVLLAPACASFDQFADFEQRGEAFRAAVEKEARR